MKRIFLCLIFLYLSTFVFSQAAGSASVSEPEIYKYIYDNCKLEEIYSTEYSIGDNILFLILNKSDKPLATTYYDKDCYYSLLIVKGNERVFTVYNLICVTEVWLNEIIFNINSKRVPTDFKIEDIEYIDKPEQTKYYAIDEMSFKVEKYLYDLK